MFFSYPVNWTETCHLYQKQGDDMCEQKINKEHLSQLPVLLFVDVLNEKDLYFLYFIHTWVKFEKDEKAKIQSNLGIGIYIQ